MVFKGKEGGLYFANPPKADSPPEPANHLGFWDKKPIFRSLTTAPILVMFN